MDLSATGERKTVFNRRGFLRTLLAAPVAAAVAAGLWKPPLPRLVRIQGKMAITGDAMKRIGPNFDSQIYQGARGGGKTEFQRLLFETLEKHQVEMNRFHGFHQVAMGEERGVR